MKMRELLLAALAATLVSPTGLAAQKDTTGSTSEAAAIRLAPVKYSREAHMQCATGSVTVQFTIDTDGDATDIAVVKSDPPGMFDEAAIASLESSRFKPRYVNGEAVPARFEYTYLFRPPPRKHQEGEPWTKNAIPVVAYQPEYPMSAVQGKDEGSVTLKFTIGVDGHPSDISVLDIAVPANARDFVRAAKAALRRSTFLPRCTEDGPVTSKGSFTYEFHMPH
ncbi:MAG TPA: energy transducer TonB [Gammaproteobacteria bacterium]|nr:energy transducer TonB [Gammaproteobacteria bacterium]